MPPDEVKQMLAGVKKLKTDESAQAQKYLSKLKSGEVLLCMEFIRADSFTHVAEMNTAGAVFGLGREGKPVDQDGIDRLRLVGHMIAADFIVNAFDRSVNLVWR